jgi:hypothetical protein
MLNEREAFLEGSGRMAVALFGRNLPQKTR